MVWPTFVKEFQWTVVEGKSQAKATNHNSADWFFTFEACERAAFKYVESDVFEYDEGERWSNLSIVIDIRCIPLLSACEISERLALYIMRKEIEDLTKANCYACAIDDPSQVAHMHQGCLMEWSDAVDVFMHLCLLRLNVKTVEPYLDHIAKVLDISASELNVDLSDPKHVQSLKDDTNTDYDLLFELN